MTAIGLQQAGTSGTQTVAVNLSTQTATSNMAGSQPLHITMTSQSIQSLTLPPGLTGLTQGGTMLQTQPFAQVLGQSLLEFTRHFLCVSICQSLSQRIIRFCEKLRTPGGCLHSKRNIFYTVDCYFVSLNQLV